MKILYAGMKYDYGIPGRGYSFEHYNFYDTLCRMGHSVEYFDFMSLYQQHGSAVMSSMLRQRIDELKPDLLFVFLFTDQFDPHTLRKITEEGKTITFNWFADDHWRFETFSKHWADCFSFVATTDIHSLPKYAAIGYSNVLLTQWGVNHFSYQRRGVAPAFDISFVGQAHGDRKKIIDRLKRQGFQISVRGTHWNLTTWHKIARKVRLFSDPKIQSIINETKIAQEEMIDMFNQSKINLNLTASSQTNFRNQIKGRNFEIPGCGGFQLSEYAERIEEFFIPNKEIVCFSTTDEMEEKIRYYLAHETERAAIADAGYRRALAEHTYEHRFNELFRMMGLQP